MFLASENSGRVEINQSKNPTKKHYSLKNY